MVFNMKEGNYSWLAASYQMPMTYSCRMPMSSPHSGLALPTPGPATVRMALIRTGIEKFNKEFVREELFSEIMSTTVLIKPAEKVAISSQISQAYKAESSTSFSKTIAYRGFAHAEGPIIVYIHIPEKLCEVFVEILLAIGYWGQASSFAYCTAINDVAPKPGDCAIPLRVVDTDQHLHNYFTSFVTEVSDQELQWSDISPDINCRKKSPFYLELQVWPLVFLERTSGGCILHFKPLKQIQDV